MGDLARQDCVPCRGDVPPLGAEEVKRLLSQLNGWQAEGVHHIRRDYSFRNFLEAKSFVDHISEIAEEQGHHPDIYFTWGKARVEIRTHSIDGLTESDFVLAAKFDEVSD